MPNVPSSCASCECSPDSFPFFCERHQTYKTKHLHKLCKTRPAYRELWEAGHGPGQPVDPTASPRQKFRPPLEERIRTFIETKAEQLERKFSESKVLSAKQKRYRTLEQALSLLAICRRCDQFHPTAELCGLLKGCGKKETYQHQLVSVRGGCPNGRWINDDPCCPDDSQSTGSAPQSREGIH